MKRIILFLSIFLLVINFNSCKKKTEEKKNELPTGENTFYCYIDGELYLPKGDGWAIPKIPGLNFSNCLDWVSFDIYAGNVDIKRDINLHFHNGISETGTITLMQSNYDMCYVGDNHGNLTVIENEHGVDVQKYYYTHDGSGAINITYLSDDKRHFKGTFEMTVYHEDTNAPIHITDGHFNIIIPYAIK